jgi:hypothetical protein
MRFGTFFGRKLLADPKNVHGLYAWRSTLTISRQQELSSKRCTRLDGKDRKRDPLKQWEFVRP